MSKAYTHCGYCGEAYSDPGWPRSCASCKKITYLNPIPVVVAMVPVDEGILCVRRSIPPKVGSLALPGGFLDVGETWQEGCARELFEETVITFSPDEISIHEVVSPPDNTLLLFCKTDSRTRIDLDGFTANEEVSELVVLTVSQELAFPLHTQMVGGYLASVR